MKQRRYIIFYRMRLLLVLSLGLCVLSACTSGSLGAGLGLSIAQSIAAIHDGALTLKSTLGQGTTATFVFPLPQES